MSQGGGTPAEATSSKQRQGLFGDIKISEQARWRSKEFCPIGTGKASLWDSAAGTSN